MKLELDPDELRVSMDMWRKAIDMEIPLAPSIRSHFLSRRGALLEGFVKTANNWASLLHYCKATGDDQLQLEALRGEIDAFKDWAEAGIDDLAKLAAE
jgi:hypothetical protein